MRHDKFIILFMASLMLMACQAKKPFIAADVIIKDAHGGGSVVQFNQHETLLASGGWAGYIRLWKLPSGNNRLSWKAHQNEVTGIEFVNDDKVIISTGHDGFIKIWTDNGKLSTQVNTQSPIRTMAVDEDRELIVTGHIDGSVRKWHLQDLTLIDKTRQHRSAVRAVALEPTSGLIASSGSSGDTLLWIRSGQFIELPSTPSDIRTLAFSNQGKVLLGGGWFNLYRWTLADNYTDNYTVIYTDNQADKKTALKLEVLKTEHHGIIRNIEMLRDGETLASISRQTDSAVLFLDPLSGKVKQRFQPHDLCGADVTVSSKQKYLATTSDDASVRIWWLEQEKSDH
jgi:WD40 repeat protein